MQWFRVYHDLVTDPKLHEIARRARVNRGQAIAAWVAILTTASKSDKRGVAEGINPVQLGYLIDIKPAVAERIIASIVEQGMMLANGTVTAWSRHDGGDGDRPGPAEWSALRAAVFERDGFACAYCGDTNGPFECDHVHPVSKGGGHGLENLVTACRPCNRSKAARVLEDWHGWKIA